jgi:hypothetical protein
VPELTAIALHRTRSIAQSFGCQDELRELKRLAREATAPTASAPRYIAAASRPSSGGFSPRHERDTAAIRPMHSRSRPDRLTAIRTTHP